MPEVSRQAVQPHFLSSHCLVCSVASRRLLGKPLLHSGDPSSVETKGAWRLAATSEVTAHYCLVLTGWHERQVCEQHPDKRLNGKCAYGMCGGSGCV